LKYRSGRGIVTVVGAVRVRRKYYRCGGCAQGVVPFDSWAGVGKSHLTIGACRLACLAAAAWSFDKASEHLHEFCGLSISDQTIRRVADAEGTRAAEWLDTAYAATTKFTRAAGAGMQTEFSGDGTMVNTIEGWKEMRVTSLARRRPGKGVDPCAWEQVEHRVLPKAEARLVTARFAECEQVGAMWKAQATRLGLGDGTGVSVLCDGAKWIWNQIGRALPRSEEVVDIYHLSEHVHRCAGVLGGEHTPAAAAWADRTMMDLIRHGSGPTLSGLEGLLASWDKQRPAAQKALLSLIGYIRDNRTRMNYADRLKRGLAIGSGQIEGACKTVVGRRLKLNCARWRPERAQHLVALPSLQYSDLWQNYWSARAA